MSKIIHIAILLNISYEGHVQLIPASIYIIAKPIQYSNNACFLNFNQRGLLKIKLFCSQGVVTCTHYAGLL